MARPPGFDKQTVLEAVQRQFRKTGYAGTSLDDITAVTGLGRGSLYAAFGDKQSLFMEALTDYCDRSERSLLESLTGPDESALQRLRDFLDNTVRFIFEDDDELGCMAGRFAVELGQQECDAAARIRQDHRVVQQALVACVEGAQRNGDISPDVNPADLACLLVTISRGIDVVAKAGGSCAEMTAVADSAFACLPLTPRARARV
jgi:TetR/AcrR family transcriptional regulator, transcriptional repressor for nem operon